MHCSHSSDALSGLCCNVQPSAVGQQAAALLQEIPAQFSQVLHKCAQNCVQRLAVASIGVSKIRSPLSWWYSRGPLF